MSVKSNQKEAPDRGEHTSYLLVTAALVAGCVAVYFLFDWFAGWIFDGLPEALQNFLIFVGVLLLMIDWLRRGVNWIERDLERIRKVERAANERDFNSQPGKVQISKDEVTKH